MNGASGRASSPSGGPLPACSSRALLAAVVTAVAIVSPAIGRQEPAPELPTWDPAEGRLFGLDWDGRLDFRYRYRSVPGEWRDQDLFGSLGAETRIPGVGKDGLRIALSGAFVLDLDEFADPGNPFTGLAETFDSRFHAYLYEGYGEFDPGGAIARARLGRQMLWREEGIRFDGLRVEMRREGAFDFALYGGVPVHFYESSRSGDLVAGVGAGWHPSRTLRFGLDEIWVRDRRDLPGVPSIEGDLLSVLTGEWRPDSRWIARGSFSALDAKERRQTLELSFADPDLGFRASSRLLRQNDFTDIPVNEFSPFVATLGAFAPYVQWQVDASKTLFRPVELGAGYTTRRLIEGENEGLFNHEFDHPWILLLLSPFPVEDASVNLRGDFWNGGGRDFGTFGGGVEKKFGKDLRVSAGTDYSLYRIDLLSGDERFRSRQWYGRARWRARKNLDLGIGYRYERDSLDRYHVADLSLGIRF